MKKILILSASPRKNGNSDLLCRQFKKGAEESGHEVEQIYLYDKKIGFCRACYACFKTGRCVMQDDIRIDQAIANGEFMNNEVIREACKKARDKKKAVAFAVERKATPNNDYRVGNCYFHYLVAGVKCTIRNGISPLVESYSSV